MRLLAHSAKGAVPAQSYEDHVRAVEGLARTSAARAVRFWAGDRDAFCDAVAAAARLHDLGKVDPKNQSVLGSQTRERLPVPHEEAGVRYLVDRRLSEAAALVYSHHRGLPDGLKAAFYGSQCLGASPEAEDGWVAGHVDEWMRRYETLHHGSFGAVQERPEGAGDWRAAAGKWTGLTWRLALSCLVDADHGDTARNYRREGAVEPPEPRWAERLGALDHFVAGLAAVGSARGEVRRSVYEALRKREDLTERFLACDSPVGTGKTTAVMAHLLGAARACGLRHVFVVLPYVNIINQSVEVYRKALVLPGEDPDRVVAAHHHESDYGSLGVRQLATLWDCPVTVTTAVQFFETISSNHPARLRKLHELPGSAVFVDEAHAAIPSWLWRQTWRWLRELTEDWGCHVVLASGSLARFWEQGNVVDSPQTLRDLVPEALRATAQRAEGRRVRYTREGRRMGPSELVEFVFDERRPGPRVVVLNTVQSAAVFAKACREAGRCTFHLSTALAPRDRAAIVEKVRARLGCGGDGDWALVGTSCIEAGLDFDFRSAIREAGPVASMVQLGGRLNRNAASEVGTLTVVSLDAGGGAFTELRPITRQAMVLDKFFKYEDVNGLSPAELCTRAMRRELEDAGLKTTARLIPEAEEKRNFAEVAKLYRVIEEDTVTAVVDDELAELLGGHERVDPPDVLRCSVRIRRRDIRRYGLEELAGGEIYRWTLRYDAESLGYMAGVLEAGIADPGSFLGV